MSIVKDDIDFKKIEFEFGEDWDIFQELIKEYKIAHNDYFSDIKTAIDNKDSDQLRIGSHTLKGIVANFYCDKLKSLAAKLEELGRNSEFVDAIDCFVELKSSNTAVMALLDDYDKSR